MVVSHFEAVLEVDESVSDVLFDSPYTAFTLIASMAAAFLWLFEDADLFDEIAVEVVDEVPDAARVPDCVVSSKRPSRTGSWA